MIPPKEWFINLPKIIDNNGCWISNYAIRIDGYVRFKYNLKIMLLHRASMCAFSSIEYDNPRINARHDRRCSRACFNPEHLKSGSHYDNMQDAKANGSYNNKPKNELCPKCGGRYTTVTNKRGYTKGKGQRYCKVCFNLRRRKK